MSFLFIFYNIALSWLNPLDSFRFNILLRDSEKRSTETCITAYPNLVNTLQSCKIMWFLRKSFCMKRLKTCEKVRRCLGILFTRMGDRPWNVKTVFRNSSSWHCSCDWIIVPPVLKMAAWSSSVIPATKCSCVETQSPNNIRNCLLCFSESRWPTFLGWYTWSLPFSHIFVHNRR